MPCSIIAGFKWSMIDYAQKLETLFAKMEGIRTSVLPPNRAAFDDYFETVWVAVRTLTDVVSSLSAGLDNPEKFKSYIDAEDRRLGKNLRAVDYVIDGNDTLTLITGGGRIEKVRIVQRTSCYLEFISHSIVDRFPTVILANEAPL